MLSKLKKMINLMFMNIEEEEDEILTFYRQLQKIDIQYEELQF